MKVGQKQRLFATKLVPMLITYAEMLGYEVTFGDAYRDPRVFGDYWKRQRKGYGAAQSNHKLRLAINLNLFKDGRYLTSTEAHAPLGRFWLNLTNDIDGIETAWGGISGDGNHYSIRHNGKW